MGRWADAVLESEMRNRVALRRAGRDSFPRPSAAQARRASIRLTRYDGPISFRQATDRPSAWS